MNSRSRDSTHPFHLNPANRRHFTVRRRAGGALHMIRSGRLILQPDSGDFDDISPLKLA